MLREAENRETEEDPTGSARKARGGLHGSKCKVPSDTPLLLQWNDGAIGSRANVEDEDAAKRNVVDEDLNELLCRLAVTGWEKEEE